jgi:hypothetical protein
MLRFTFREAVSYRYQVFWTLALFSQDFWVDTPSLSVPFELLPYLNTVSDVLYEDESPLMQAVCCIRDPTEESRGESEVSSEWASEVNSYSPQPVVNYDLTGQLLMV